MNTEGGDGRAVDRLDDANALTVRGRPYKQAVHFGNNFLDENLKLNYETLIILYENCKGSLYFSRIIFKIEISAGELQVLTK